MKRRTTNPFGVNLRADAADIGDRIKLLIDEQVKVASFAQAPKEALIGRLHDGGVLVVPSIGAKRHAEKVLEWGVDAVLVQGGEGGGHTGSVPTTILLPQVVDAVQGRVPVIAAGGFFDGRGLVAALAYGADAVAMGTRFLLSADSAVPQVVKDYYLGKTVTAHRRDQADRRRAAPHARHRAGRRGRVGLAARCGRCRERPRTHGASTSSRASRSRR